jgi:hypothetical protein
MEDLRPHRETGEIEWPDLSAQDVYEWAFLDEDDDAESENLSDGAALSTAD